jgi:hypothetical protein
LESSSEHGWDDFVEADDILEGVVVESTHTLSLALNLSCLSRTLMKNRDDEHERFCAACS